MRKTHIFMLFLFFSGCGNVAPRNSNGENQPVEGVFRNATRLDISDRFASACGQMGLETPLKLPEAVECRKPAQNEDGLPTAGEEIVRIVLTEVGNDVGASLVAYKVVPQAQGPRTIEYLMSKKDLTKMTRFLKTLGAEV